MLQTKQLKKCFDIEIGSAGASSNTDSTTVSAILIKPTIPVSASVIDGFISRVLRTCKMLDLGELWILDLLGSGFKRKDFKLTGYKLSGSSDRRRSRRVRSCMSWIKRMSHSRCVT